MQVNLELFSLQQEREVQWWKGVSGDPGLMRARRGKKYTADSQLTGPHGDWEMLDKCSIISSIVFAGCLTSG